MNVIVFSHNSYQTDHKRESLQTLKSVWHSPTALNIAFSVRVNIAMVTFSVVTE